jgi:pimeloyl-ACP methyl ester carboxylesterase
VQAVIADSCVARIPPERLQLVVATREQRTPVQVAFWQQGHGPDWAAVIEADNELFLQLAERGGDWFEGRLSKIHCPVLFTASLADEALPAVGEQVCDMMQQVPGSQASLTSEGAHPMMWSRADVFRRVVDSFLDDLVKRDQE